VIIKRVEENQVNGLSKMAQKLSDEQVINIIEHKITFHNKNQQSFRLTEGNVPEFL
jgi:hypothetical protein